MQQFSSVAPQPCQAKLVKTRVVKMRCKRILYLNDEISLAILPLAFQLLLVDVHL